MSNSLIMMVNTSSTAVLSGGIIPLTTITRRRCNAISTANNSIILNRVGYYKVNASITFSGDNTGEATVTLQKNDVDVVGITATTTITTADTEIRTLNLSGVVRVMCNEGFATLTLSNTEIPITTTNVELDVEYLG